MTTGTETDGAPCWAVVGKGHRVTAGGGGGGRAAAAGERCRWGDHLVVGGGVGLVGGVLSEELVLWRGYLERLRAYFEDVLFCRGYKAVVLLPLSLQ